MLSQGESLDELKENIRDAYKLMVESEPQGVFPPSRKQILMELGS